MKTVLIWGFYNEGNIGDDLMGMMLYEMLEEIGARPIVYSANPRFSATGYRTVDRFDALDPDLIVLGGGAFVKDASSSKPSIEKEVATLGLFVKEKSIPVHAISIGSDGVNSLDEISPARRSVVKGRNFQSAVLRLEADLQLGLPSAMHLPDIVLLAGYCSQRYERLKPIDPIDTRPRTLINLSRRSASKLPSVLWRERRRLPAFFRAHTSMGNTGGEVTLPGFPVISDERVAAQLGHLKAARKIVSSKLHPGVIALSFGNEFLAVAPRPKTIAFLSRTRPSEVDFTALHSRYAAHLRMLLE